MRDLSIAIQRLGQSADELTHLLNVKYLRRKEQLRRRGHRNCSTEALLWLHEAIKKELANKVYSKAQRQAIMGALNAWSPPVAVPKVRSKAI